MLERLVGRTHYYCLDGYSGFYQILITQKIKRKLCSHVLLELLLIKDALRALEYPNQFLEVHDQHFFNFIECIIEVFMDDLTVYGNSFNELLDNSTKVLKQCLETNLILNYKKYHFMVDKELILGHVVSSKGIEVDRAKVDVIKSLPHPKNIR